jgi:hypothetical protein
MGTGVRVDPDSILPYSISLSHTHTATVSLSRASTHLHRPIRICETRRPSPTPPERTVRILELQPCFGARRSLPMAGGRAQGSFVLREGPMRRAGSHSTRPALDTGAKKSLPPKVLPSARLSSRFQHSQARMRQGFCRRTKNAHL